MPREVFKRPRCSTWGYGLVVNVAALASWLGFMILEDFSNLNNNGSGQVGSALLNL